jgi:conserverd hypothetical protein
MKKQLLITMSAMFMAGAAQAYADCGDYHQIDNCDVISTYTGATTLSPLIVTNGTSEATSRHHKVIVEAKQDADAFIASEGQIYGAFLAQAIEQLRSSNPSAAMASDMELAQAILSY